MTDYSKIASDYAKHRRVHPEVIKALVSGAKIGSSSKVLEVGCGTGNYIQTLNQLTACLSYGIDPSPEMLSIAKQTSSSLLEFSQGRGENLEYANDYFDLLFSVDVIHHIRDRACYFKEAFRVLKQSGRVSTVTDSEWIIRNREPQSVYFPETVGVELKRYPKINEIRQLMQEAGFSEITDRIVEFDYKLKDIEGYRRKVFSSLLLISEEEFQSGLRRMEEDLARNPIQCVSRYLLVWGTKSM